MTAAAPPRRRLTLAAPAKINLDLRVLGRRPDGYHELESIFLPLALSDRVEVEVTAASPDGPGRVRCVCPGHPELEGEANLAARAATLHLEACGRRAPAGTQGVQIRVTVHKSIWVAAGLGGGSSDAAAVLLALQQLLPPLPASELRALALRLGADVPYFLEPRPARVTGIGERITPLRRFPQALPLVLANPGRPLRTAAVFAGLGLQPGQAAPAPTPAGPADLDGPVDLAGVISLIHNDLEPVATGILPEIAELRRLLRDLGALGVGMSGSGPTVFGLVDAAERASALADKVMDTTGFSAVATRLLAA